MPKQYSRDSIYCGPLYSPGVHHATVNSPTAAAFPDPMGYLNSQPPELRWIEAGGGDEINDWADYGPDDGRG